MKKLIIAILIPWIFGCALPEKTKDYEPANSIPGKALVYLYRLDSTVDTANPDVPIFYIGNEKIGKLKLGGYYYSHIQPGKTLIRYANPIFGMELFKSPLKLEFQAEVDKVYFVEYRVEIVGLMQKQSILRLVPEATGQLEIKRTKLLENK